MRQSSKKRTLPSNVALNKAISCSNCPETAKYAAHFINHREKFRACGSESGHTGAKKIPPKRDSLQLVSEKSK
jgi:hypothetical protein